MTHSQGPTPASRRRLQAFGVMFGVVTAAVVGSLMVAVPGGLTDASALPVPAPVVSAGVATAAPAASPGIGVPDASEVFKGRPTVIEELPPTF